MTQGRLLRAIGNNRRPNGRRSVCFEAGDGRGGRGREGIALPPTSSRLNRCGRPRPAQRAYWRVLVTSLRRSGAWHRPLSRRWSATDQRLCDGRCVGRPWGCCSRLKRTAGEDPAPFLAGRHPSVQVNPVDSIRERPCPSPSPAVPCSVAYRADAQADGAAGGA